MFAGRAAAESSSMCAECAVQCNGGMTCALFASSPHVKSVQAGSTRRDHFSKLQSSECYLMHMSGLQ